MSIEIQVFPIVLIGGFSGPITLRQVAEDSSSRIQIRPNAIASAIAAIDATDPLPPWSAQVDNTSESELRNRVASFLPKFEGEWELGPVIPPGSCEHNGAWQPRPCPIHDMMGFRLVRVEGQERIEAILDIFEVTNTLQSLVKLALAVQWER